MEHEAESCADVPDNLHPPNRRNAVVAILTYLLLVPSTFPEMSMQMLGAGLHWLDKTLVLLMENVLATNGWLGLGLVVAYALLTGVAVTNTIVQVSVTGVLPGLLASGCASYGGGTTRFSRLRRGAGDAAVPRRPAPSGRSRAPAGISRSGRRFARVST